MLYLEVLSASGRRLVPIDTDLFTIGRSSENRLQLTGGDVSRRHAEIVVDGHGWKIRDRDSRLGVWVNNVKVPEAPLCPGDRVRLGQCELRVSDGGATQLSSGVTDFRQMNALLAGLRALGSSRVLEEVLAIVLDSALELTGAERGFILMADAKGTLTPTLARARGGRTLTDAQTSRRIPQEVFATGRDQMVTDLLDNEQAGQHQGTIEIGIRHVLCTPLHVMEYSAGVSRRVGVLYLDSTEKGYLRHATTLHALAAEAAVVIENARLYREVVAQERAAQELRFAAEIQRALLPPASHACSRMELAASMTPCRAIGGDFYDYMTQPDGGVALALGDVAGKGTSAALLTAVVQGLFTAESAASDAAGQVLSRINRALCRRAIDGRFVTAFYGQRTCDGVFRYCNAGHNAPFLVSADTVVRLETGGPMLGIFDQITFETGEATVRAGDLLVLFSDGVTEAQNPAGEEFGDERLAASLDRVRTRPAQDVLDAVHADLRAFRQSMPANDDVTVMAVKFR